MKKNSIILLAAFLLLLISAGDKSVEGVSVKLDPSDSMETVVRKASMVRPSERQVKWQEMEFIMFAHFGMNTYTNKEWGNGKEDPKLFNPTNFDARQWAREAKDAGAKMIIVNAKHHDGFCYWPSKYTEYSVKNSPWKGGKGDVVAEVAAACREAGIKFGVYLSPWDRHEKTYGTKAYNDYYKNQLRELLTNYGEVSEVWMDGAGTGKKHKQMLGLYDWDGFFQIVREIQPNAVISISGPDVRWIGNEAGKGRVSEWSVLPDKIDESAPDLGSRAKLMEYAEQGQALRWRPAEVDVSIRPGWYYHSREDGKVKPLKKLEQIYFSSVGENAMLLLNIPPDRRGLFPEQDVARLREFRNFIKETFKDDLALHASAKADSVPGNDGAHSADKTVDGDPETYWMAGEGAAAATIEYDLGSPRPINIAVLQEYIPLGQRVEQFALDAWDGAGWKQIVSATTIGYKRILRFAPITVQKVRLRIEGSRACPAISNFELYYAPSLKTG
jgi:alpha-L-fucosidase